MYWKSILFSGKLHILHLEKVIVVLTTHTILRLGKNAQNITISNRPNYRIILEEPNYYLPCTCERCGNHDSQVKDIGRHYPIQLISEVYTLSASHEEITGIWGAFDSLFICYIAINEMNWSVKTVLYVLINERVSKSLSLWESRW